MFFLKKSPKLWRKLSTRFERKQMQVEEVLRSKMHKRGFVRNLEYPCISELLEPISDAESEKGAEAERNDQSAMRSSTESFKSANETADKVTETDSPGDENHGEDRHQGDSGTDSSTVKEFHEEQNEEEENEEEEGEENKKVEGKCQINNIHGVSDRISRADDPQKGETGHSTSSPGLSISKVVSVPIIALASAVSVQHAAASAITAPDSPAIKNTVIDRPSRNTISTPDLRLSNLFRSEKRNSCYTANYSVSVYSDIVDGHHSGMSYLKKNPMIDSYDSNLVTYGETETLKVNLPRLPVFPSDNITVLQWARHVEILWKPYSYDFKGGMATELSIYLKDDIRQWTLKYAYYFDTKPFEVILRAIVKKFSSPKARIINICAIKSLSMTCESDREIKSLLKKFYQLSQICDISDGLLQTILINKLQNRNDLYCRFSANKYATVDRLVTEIYNYLRTRGPPCIPSIDEGEDAFYESLLQTSYQG